MNTISLTYYNYFMHTGRKTLHGHWLLWVKNFKELRHRLFHRDKIIQEAARLEYTQYIDEIMCSSFGEKLCIIHKYVVRRRQV